MALTDSLISFWELEESSGTRMDAVVATGNDLIDNNTVTQNTGKVGKAAQFTAVNSEFLSHVSNVSLQTGDIDFTFAFWSFLDSKQAADNSSFITKWDFPDALREYVFDYDFAQDRFRFIVSPDGSAFTIVLADNLGSPALATWYSIIGWHNAADNTINIQVNNGAINTVAHSTGVFVGTSPFDLGALNNFISFHDGRLDQVGFWKRVLTSAEKTFLYNNGNGRSFAEVAAGLSVGMDGSSYRRRRR